MNIDFHTHGKLSKKIPFSVSEFIESVKEAKESGLDAIALTEHFNAVGFLDVYKSMDEHFPYQEDFYNVNGVQVFPGMEVDAKEGGHFLFIGTRENIRDFWYQLEPYQSKENFLPIKEILSLAEPYSFLQIGAHPFRLSNSLTQHDSSVFNQLDALDLNAKDLYKMGIKMKDKLMMYSYEKDLPILAGSDTHHYLQYGSVVNRFHKECKTVDELKQVLRTDNYDLYISPHLEIKVKAATAIKKVLKSQCAESSLS
ncbi:PHP domain-containing protein [Gracilibacillus sp. S3-1-1]|uniref:PHP domain-containing protein n=1 Tax=Gracilibacillus pellucidus TaxID=3095368 RepID=A0ACC6M371_9BACI|nr:PHP domain-containing protein [Gracilibacillus sp. S3-1-1]MDX8045323.1 PHP domain-containing protein [Gracilibacillus sp. S3-1-1]